MAKKISSILMDDLRIEDPHEVFLGMFEPSNNEPFLHGTDWQYHIRLFIFLIALIALRAFFSGDIPGMLDVLFIVVISAVSVFFLVSLSSSAIPLVLRLSYRSVKMIAALTGMFLIIGLMLSVR